MSKNILRIIFMLCILTPSLYAKNWQFDIAPYLWAINMNGDVQLGSTRAHVNEDASELFKQFTGGGMLWLEANKDRFGFFANVVYAVLQDNINYSGVNIHTKQKFGLYTLGGSYTAYKKQYSTYSILELQPYIGARITNVDANLTIQDFNINASNNHTWTDPIIGLRLDYDFNRNWLLILAADIGGTNFNNHKSCNLNGYIGYKSSSIRWLSGYLGYRWLNQHYSTGSGTNYFLWNMKLFGPALGIMFTF